MASYITPVVHATNDVFAVTDYNTLASNSIFNFQTPYANYYNSVATALTNGVATQVTLGGTTSSAYGFSVSSNNIILPLSGAYFVAGNVIGTTNSGIATQYFQAQIFVAGTSALIGSICPTTTTLSGSHVSGVITGTAGTTVGLYGFQNQTTVNTVTGPNETYLSIFFIGSL